MLIVSDVAALTAAFLVSEALFPSHTTANRLGVGWEAVVFLCCLPLWLLVANMQGLYVNHTRRTTHGTADEIPSIFHLTMAGTWMVFLATSISNLADPYPPKILLFAVAALLLTILGRVMARAISRRQTARIQRVVILGSGSVADRLVTKYRSHPEYGVEVLGVVDEAPYRVSEASDVLGNPSDLPEIVSTYDVDRLMVAFSAEPVEYIGEVLQAVRSSGVQVDIVPRLFDYIGPNSYLHTVEGLPLVGLPPANPSTASLAGKRTLDLVVSVSALVILSPVLAAIAFAVKVTSRGPVFYRHERVGRGGTRLRVFKFRTMKLEACRGIRYGGAEAERIFHELMADADNRAEFKRNYKLRLDPRVTSVGSVLRRYSLDELPQLINVVSGQMSLVGPRPVTEEELGMYDAAASEILSISPGVTGYWQVNGRSGMDYEERVALDRAYVASRSFGLDLLILVKTVRVLFAKSGAF
jgi:exopolysaccharide biosynthesis polyprenyl glycosylphosphotransferase